MGQLRAAWSVARIPILFGAVCFMLGVLSVDQTPPPAEAPVVTITDRSVRQLARALEQARTDPATPEALVEQADDVLGDINGGAVTVTPTPRATTTWPPPSTTTTTTVPPTTTTVAAPADDTYRWPTTTVPPPFTVTVP